MENVSGSGLFQLLVLTSDGKSADMDGDGYHNLGVSGWFSCFRVGIAGFHPFPLGSSVLEPDFDLHFTEFEGVSDLGSLCQRQVLFAMKFLFQL